MIWNMKVFGCERNDLSHGDFQNHWICDILVNGLDDLFTDGYSIHKIPLLMIK